MRRPSVCLAAVPEPCFTGGMSQVIGDGYHNRALCGDGLTAVWEAAELSAQAVAAVQAQVRWRVLRWFVRPVSWRRPTGGRFSTGPIAVASRSTRRFGL